MEAERTPILEVQNLTKRFGATLALDDVSLAILYTQNEVSHGEEHRFEVCAQEHAADL